jgi:formate dehydrogenase major subunit
MPKVNLTIDGQKVQAEFGQTVYEAATAAGIYIPTLCNHPALKPEGACRMCLVEIERQRSLQPSCTFPATEGLVVHTDSPRVLEARKFVLELIFSERVHYCMFCAVSGSQENTQCELQKLAYENHMTHWQFPENTCAEWPVDATRQYFIMDHSRCILCRRCIRACDDIAANHTLGLMNRGIHTMIIADANAPLGESSCVSCGTCLQVCPTGALIDRRSAYMGGACEVQRTDATCLACPVGCGIEIVTRSNNLLRVEGDWDAANGGLLCVTGRFEPCEPQPERVTQPMVRRNDAWEKVSWGEALAAAADGLRQAGSVAGLASPRSTNEALAAFKALLGDALKSDQAALLYGETPEAWGARATLQDVPVADLLVVVGANPLEEQKVIGYLAKRAADKGARILIVSDEATELDPWARKRLPMSQVGEIAAEVAAAKKPVVLPGPDLPADVLDALRSLPETARFLPLYTGTNAAGAAALGLRTAPVKGQALFVLAGDDLPPPDGDLRRPDDGQLPSAKFVVVQAAYRSPWTEGADVVLPARVWTEQAGHIVNLEGRELPVVPATVAPASVAADVETLAGIAERVAGA